ncbi:MAG: hypothetical protein ABS896_09235 [Carnobacterium inhibens]|uniref:hypothetical protein n=1 Tax=Carnobacterium inhibens TaxID=147709 RepID=UPI0033158A54
MTKTIYEIDADGFMTYVTLEIEPNDFDGDNNPVYVIPEGYAGVPLPSDEDGKQLPFWKPKWNGTEWVEARPIEEIEEEKNKPVPPTDIEKLQQENILLKAQAQANADRADFQEEVLAEIILTIMP